MKLLELQAHGEEKMAELQSERPKENYRIPAEVESVKLKKDFSEQRYFTLSKMRTYDCELKVE